MWILRFKSRNNNVATQLPPSLQQYIIHQIHTHYSTKSTLNHQITEPHFMLDYLINSIGFSEVQALSILPKVTHLKSTQNPNSVLDFLKKSGLNKAQVMNIVNYRPQILTTDVDKTLVPKFRVLQNLGLENSPWMQQGLEKLFMQILNFSSSRLDANVSYLREVLDGDDEKVLKVVQRSWFRISSNYARKLAASLEILKRCGLSDYKIERVLLRSPECLLRSPEWVEATIKKVEHVLGVVPQSPWFVKGFEIVISQSSVTLDKKFGVYRRFGWSDSEILTMTRVSPYCLRGSEATIQASLEFFMRELGYSAAYLASHPELLVYSLEKRVMPRHKVLEMLKERNLLESDYSLCSVAAMSEEKFIKDYVMLYDAIVPRLPEAYAKAAGR